MIPFSALDLAPIVEGGDARQAFENSRDLARHAETLGYNRYWLAEHHNMPGIASAATAVVMAYVAEGTTRIRIGAGGVMLPNHAPLVIAEQFGTLEAMYPGRIDLGLGRAPGTDMPAIRALRRTLDSDGNGFPQDVLELQRFLGTAEPGQSVRAVPGEGSKIPLWILGSSTFGAQLAAALGLPYAFASHFAPAQMMEAIAIYRETFQPSAQLQKPYVMLGFNMLAADTDEEARYLATSLMQAFVNLRSGAPTKLPPPVEGYEQRLAPAARATLEQVLSCSAVGGPQTVRTRLADFIARTGADELILTSQMYDHQKRRRAFEIAVEARADISRGE
ncbi:MAG: LLM class flavin-dependent oxidoreductase [Amphiplicatus sp.]